MQFDLPAMKRAISRSPRIAADYGIVDPSDDPDVFIDQIVAALEQRPEPDPLSLRPGPSDVFKAAVRAIGSNSTKWVAYLDRESHLRELLDDFDPASVARKIASHELTAADLSTSLVGRYSKRRGEAVVAWAELLADHPNWYETLVAVAERYRHGPTPVDPRHELMMVLACHFAEGPTAAWSMKSQFPADLVPPDQHKLEGMGHAIASEFLRNLGWSGFKPDLHIRNLLTKWIINNDARWPIMQDAIADDLRRLMTATGRKNQDARNHLQYSLLGVALTPPGIEYSLADNIVWLLGANVKTASDTNYIID